MDLLLYCQTQYHFLQLTAQRYYTWYTKRLAVIVIATQPHSCWRFMLDSLSSEGIMRAISYLTLVSFLCYELQCKNAHIKQTIGPNDSVKWRQPQTSPRTLHQMFLPPMHHHKCILLRSTKRAPNLDLCSAYGKAQASEHCYYNHQRCIPCEELHDCSTCQTSWRYLYTCRVSTACKHGL